MGTNSPFQDLELEQILTFIKTNIALFVTAAALLAFFLILGILIGRSIQKAADSFVVKRARENAVKRSRSVLGGQAAEQLAPYLPGFPCNPADARFVGKPIDFVAFPGAAEGKEIREVLFVEVKTGSSTLSGREKQIKDAVRAGRVRYVEMRVGGRH